MAGKVVFISNTQEAGYEIEEKTHSGKPYLIVPVAMMVEGVHSGNHGPILHEMEELAKFPNSWNGRPVVVNHPEVDGIAVSANSPDVIEGSMVGRVYNAKADDKLRADIWLNKDRLEEVSPDLFANISAGEPIEVSTGMFIEEEAQEGLWNEENYVAVAKNIRPDHLALLPDAEGACSVEDGCGIRNNKEGENMEGEKEKEKRSMKRTKFSSNNNLNQKVEVKVDKEKKTPCCEDLVDELIANKRTKWDADNKEWLMTLEEDVLGKMIPEKEAPAETVKEPKKKEPVANKEPEKKDNIELLSAEDKAALAYGHKQLKEKREAMIKGIQDNAGKEIWPDEVLAAFDEDSLERVHKSVVKEEIADYSLNNMPVTHASDEQGDQLFPAGVEMKIK